jgi:hypothetical protein
MQACDLQGRFGRGGEGSSSNSFLFLFSKKSFLFVKKSNLLFTSHRVSPRPIRAPGVGLF